MQGGHTLLPRISAPLLMFVSFTPTALAHGSEATISSTELLATLPHDLSVLLIAYFAAFIGALVFFRFNTTQYIPASIVALGVVLFTIGNPILALIAGFIGAYVIQTISGTHKMEGGGIHG